MEDANRQLGELAVLNELAKVRKSLLLRVRDELDEVEHTLHDRPLEVVSTIITEDATEECEHTSLLARELQAERPDSLDDGDLELVRNLRHEA